jgi:hypothetical protein
MQASVATGNRQESVSTARAPRWVTRVLVLLIVIYQRIVSPHLPATCRFIPSCSQYAREAIERHGPARGLWLAARRLSRCHPFGGRGLDPVE